jgi:hypothetical protein
MVNVNKVTIGFEKLPHYCTQAVEKFSELATLLPARMGIVPDFELLLCDLMHQAVKYALPENAFMFAEQDFKPWMFERQELPHPVCALEFTATRELHAAQSNLAHAAKRIVLCFDPWLLPPEQIARLSRLSDEAFLEGVSRRCLALMVVYEANGMWGAAVGVVLIDLDADRPVVLQDVAKESPLRALGDRANARLKPTRQPSVHALPATYRTFPSRSALVGQSPADANEALYIDTLDEVRATYQFLAAVNSSQVRTLDVPAPEKLNDKRRRNGRAPFFSYKVLSL